MLESSSKMKQLKLMEKIDGIGPERAKVLFSKGYTLEKLAVVRKPELCSAIGVSSVEARGIIAQAKTLLFGQVKLETIDEYGEKMKKKQKVISLGSKKLTEMVGGGRTMTSIGFAGPQAVGKTQLINELAVNNVIQFDRVSVLIETETDTFHKERLEEMVRLRGANWDNVKDKIVIIGAERIGSPYSQFLAYELVNDKAEKENLDIGMIGVDSFTAKFRRTYLESEMLPLRSREMGRHLDYLEILSKKFNCLIALSLQVMEHPRPEGQKRAWVEFDFPYTIWGGHTLRHTINTWVALIKKKKHVWKASLFDSSFLPERTCEFMITAKGIEDIGS